MIFTDECSVELQHHSHRCYGRKGEAKKLPKHPLRVHVWAGISARGATPTVFFTGTLSSHKID